MAFSSRRYPHRPDFAPARAVPSLSPPAGWFVAAALYLFFWNVDPTIFLGTWAAPALGRWIAIDVTFAVFLLALPTARNIKGLLAILSGAFLLIPAVLASEDSGRSTIEFTRIFSLLLLFWTLSIQREIGDKIYNLLGIFSVIVVFGSLPLLNLGAQNAATGLAALGRFRSAGITPNPNNFGFISCVGFAYALSRFLPPQKSSTVEIFKNIAMLLASIACISASDSRTAIYILCIISALFFVTRSSRRPIWQSAKLNNLFRPLAVVLAIAILSAPLLIVTMGVVASSVGATGGQSNAVENSYAASNAARLALWHNAFQGFQDSPLIGSGLGLGLQEDFNPLLKRFNTAPYVHNALLNSLYTSGLIGTAFLIAVVRSSISLAIPNVVKYNFNISARAWFLLVSIVVASLVGATFEGALQTNYGLNCYLAIAMGGLASSISARATKRLSK